MRDRDRTFDSFEAFWPFYLSQHARPGTRRLHLIGTAVAVYFLARALIALEPVSLGLAVVAGYGFAWLGHAAVERNRPATFSYPLWSLAGDFRMFFLWCAGRLDSEVRAAGGARVADGG
ncbi:DUF962 domain-containing protein [Roseospira goensis]|uniref:DUF962 domain-containing protein n=1 Tax=Roseospira goensis TaxID=391922 RepID=A0A7W6RWM0_9PROT|nr:DUF962 domain-containing protein [Roseospira goensis]MBB4284512.1 hypothetical protein [Roseospira goensis]